jgi:hypothetical protein
MALDTSVTGRYVYRMARGWNHKNKQSYFRDRLRFAKMHQRIATQLKRQKL